MKKGLDLLTTLKEADHQMEMGLQKELEKDEVSPRNIPLHEDTAPPALTAHPAGLVSLATLSLIMIDIQIIEDILTGPHHEETQVHREAGALPGIGEGVVAKVQLKGEQI